jgi:hypothetical protein
MPSARRSVCRDVHPTAQPLGWRGNVAIVSSSAQSACPLRQGHDRQASAGCASQDDDIRRETVMTMDRSASGKRFWLLAVGVWACLSIAGCSSSGSAGRETSARRPRHQPRPLPRAAAPAHRRQRLQRQRVQKQRRPRRQFRATRFEPENHPRCRSRSWTRTRSSPVFTWWPPPLASAAQSGSKSGAGAKITSDNPKCAPFLAETDTGGNAGMPGVTGFASITFQADGTPLRSSSRRSLPWAPRITLPTCWLHLMTRFTVA